MEQQILILNGSPRAPISNSKAYAEQFMENCGSMAVYVGSMQTLPPAEVTASNRAAAKKNC